MLDTKYSQPHIPEICLSTLLVNHTINDFGGNQTLPKTTHNTSTLNTGETSSNYSVQGRGKLLPYILLNEIQTMFSLANRSARILPADLALIMRITSNPWINGLEKKQKHGSWRRDCFSLLYFGNSQIYWYDVVFQTEYVVFFFC